jgi:hypothetical protein
MVAMRQQGVFKKAAAARRCGDELKRFRLESREHPDQDKDSRQSVYAGDLITRNSCNISR